MQIEGLATSVSAGRLVAAMYGNMYGKVHMRRRGRVLALAHVPSHSRHLADDGARFSLIEHYLPLNIHVLSITRIPQLTENCTNDALLLRGRF
jgi:hypothetical protein